MSVTKVQLVSNVSTGASFAGIVTAATFRVGTAVSAGTTAAPSISPTGDSNTGIFFPSADTIAFAEGGAEAMRVDSSGRLLVGTSTSASTGTSQYALLQVQGWNGASTGEGIFSLQRGESSSAMSSDDPIGDVLFSDKDGGNYARISAFADAAPAAVDHPGRLVFSTTADGASSPTERMRINSAGRTVLFDSSGGGFEVASSLASGTSDNLGAGYYGATNTTTKGTPSIAIRTNGNVLNTNNSYGQLSDIKLKENITDASSQWDDLKALQVRNFNFKEGQTHTQIGLIAQEVEQISPGLVDESPDRDDDGNKTGEVTKSVKYSVLYMKAVKALQEAMGRIEQLEQRLTDAGIA